MKNIINNYWDVLNRLEVATIVVVGGRPGSDFLHTLFDSHPEILTFDGTLYFSEFYNNAKSLWKGWGPKEDLYSNKKISTVDYFNEFAWENLHKFKTRYDVRENKDKLGPKRNESNEVDIDLFVKNAIDLMEGVDSNRKNFFLATYGAFALARGEDLNKKKILLHSIKHDFRIKILCEEFPIVKVIAANRDPRAGYTISMEDWTTYAPDRISPGTHFFYIDRILQSTNCLNKFNNIEIRVNILEKLHQHPEKVMKNMCRWLGVEFDSILMRSTCGGKDWWGDAMTKGINSPFNKDRYIDSQKLWEKHMSLIDNIIFSTIMRNEIFYYSWVKKYTGLWWIFIVPLLILLPNKWDIVILFKAIKKKNVRMIVEWFYYLLKRQKLMYKKYIFSIIKKDLPIKHF